MRVGALLALPLLTIAAMPVAAQDDAPETEMGCAV